MELIKAKYILSLSLAWMYYSFRLSLAHTCTPALIRPCSSSQNPALLDGQMSVGAERIPARQQCVVPLCSQHTGL